MTFNSNKELYNDKTMRAILHSDFYKRHVDKLFYIPQKTIDEDIEVFFTPKGEAPNYEETKDFTDIVNSAVNPKGDNGYFFVYVSILDEADEDIAEKRGEMVAYGT